MDGLPDPTPRLEPEDANGQWKGRFSLPVLKDLFRTKYQIYYGKVGYSSYDWFVIRKKVWWWPFWIRIEYIGSESKAREYLKNYRNSGDPLKKIIHEE